MLNNIPVANNPGSGSGSVDSDGMIFFKVIFRFIETN